MAKSYDSAKILGGDLGNILLLTLLYCFQGIPLGLAGGSLPFLLKQHLSYTQVGIFSLVSYPFSLKFLWSPLIDAYFFKSLGRRKSWVIPMELMAGAMMIYLSYNIDSMLIDDSYIWTLTSNFFILIFLFATHDIAVDGWALEILQEENKTYASSCQTLGQTVGFFTSFTFLIAFNNPDFCNAYIFSVPQTEGLLQVSEYMHFWGFAYIISSLCILIFIHEEPMSEYGDEMHILEIYKQVGQILKLSSVKWLVLVLVTSKVATSAHDNIMGLQLLDKGFPQASLASFAVLMLPVEIAISVSLGWFSKTESLMNMYLTGFGLRLVSVAYGFVVLYLYPEGPITSFYYILVLSCAIINSVGANCMMLSMCGFFNKIADSNIGGTYITILNTFSNIGYTWPKFLVLYAVDLFTEECTECEGCLPCSKSSAGYYTVSGSLLIAGLAYFYFLKASTDKIQRFPLQAWRTQRRSD
mmetsp:Transcript_2155/g.5419  ORF Transcript_2155/g.5419 Transcript_2155/m.5419 type:complete len:469 (-) Transcript_2155:724-2130(-)